MKQSLSPDFWQDKRVLLTGHTGFKGGWLALWRILRCNPFCKGGYDPVPQALDTTIRRE